MDDRQNHEQASTRRHERGRAQPGQALAPLSFQANRDTATQPRGQAGCKFELIN
jgi:hypothetical protein